MPVYAVVHGRVEDRAKLDEYVRKIPPTFAGYKLRILAVDEAPEVIEGEVDYPRTVVIEFESKEAFHKWYQSPEYQKILPLRLDAGPGTFVLAEGFAPPSA